MRAIRNLWHCIFKDANSAVLCTLERPHVGSKYRKSYVRIQGFWKGWHASFNQWLVRYIYVPLGGSSMRLLNIWLIFTFVALW